MKATSTVSLLAVILTAAACQETQSTALETDMVPSLAVVGNDGIGALVAPSCFAPRGAIIETLVPISDTDWWVTAAEVVSSNCRTLPGGALIENFTIRVLSDIPLPDKSHRGSLADGNVFDIYLPGVGLVAEDVPLSCAYDGDAVGETLNADFVTTPSGLNSNVCRFAAPSGT